MESACLAIGCGIRFSLQRPLCRLERLGGLDPNESDRWSAEVVVLGPRHGHRFADPFRNLIGFELRPDGKDEVSESQCGPANRERRHEDKLAPLEKTVRIYA